VKIINMKDKYYTPEIEEFHVGFEYEVKGLKGWDKKIVSSSQDILEMEELMMRSLNPYRVKYLDREDIESLGFKQTSNRNNFRHGDTLIYFRENKDELYPIDIKLKKETYRFLKIKNKSELKRLLKQLGI